MTKMLQSSRLKSAGARTLSSYHITNVAHTKVPPICQRRQHNVASYLRRRHADFARNYPLRAVPLLGCNLLDDGQCHRHTDRRYFARASKKGGNQQNFRNVSILNEDAEKIIKQIPLEDVRNFCLIAHIDHGKSSLSSRILELTGNLGPEAQAIAQAAADGKLASDQDDTQSQKLQTKSTPATSSQKEQYELFDTLSVEQQRGITIKASTATMLYPHPSAVGPTGVLLLNLIDTPGHVDFGREVQRTLSFVQGAVLLLDATQGIQAQTWKVYDQALSMVNRPELLLALTKIDMDAARPVHVALQVSEWLNWDDPDDIIHTSARNRIGVKDIVDTVCRLVPPPKPLEDDVDNADDAKTDNLLRAQVVDSWYDDRGVNCLVQVVSGELSEGDRIVIVRSSTDEEKSTNQQSFSVQEVGMVLPHNKRTGYLLRGQLGYVRFGLRDPRQAMPGTILILQKHAGRDMVMPYLPNIQDATKSVLYASVHPSESDGFDELCNAVDRLALNDTGLEVSRTSALSGGERGGPFLGPGLKVGFQGILHMEVFRQRLLDEFDIEAIVTPPKVPYRLTFKDGKNKLLKQAGPDSEPVKIIEDLSNWPPQGVRFKIEEPMVSVKIMAPVEHAGSVMELISRRRGVDLSSKPIDEEIWIFTAQMPWAEVVVDFHDQLKNVTAGFGSLDTTDGDPPFREANVNKVSFALEKSLWCP